MVNDLLSPIDLSLEAVRHAARPADTRVPRSSILVGAVRTSAFLPFASPAMLCGRFGCKTNSEPNGTKCSLDNLLTLHGRPQRCGVDHSPLQPCTPAGFVLAGVFCCWPTPPS